MAFPILLNIRHVPTDKPTKDIYMALSNFSITDSGILFACNYDEKHDIPWGVTIDQVKGGNFGFFSNLSTEKLQEFSSEFSSLLNSFYGLDSTNKPIAMKPEELASKLGEQVFTLVDSKDGKGVTLISVGVTQKELFEKAPKDIPFLADFPEEFLSNKKQLESTKAANS